MTSGLLAAMLIIGLVVSALAGPRVLHSAAPLLMRVPRLAAGLLAGGVAAWVLTLLAVGPVLAWVLSGPVVLPARAAQVCEQCLAAANPFGDQTFNTPFPVAILLALPAAAVLLHLTSVSIETIRRRRSTLRTAMRYRQTARPRRMHGYDVLLADDSHPFALSLPRRHGGIVISTGAVQLFSVDELVAVLAHEHAHLQQRHHLITAIVSGLTTRLRWIPMLAAAEDALGHYLEIAADDHARRVSGTPALAGALLVLGQAARLSQQPTAEGALYALGPNRIAHLVQPDRGTAGAVAATASTCCMAALIALAAFVHIPYMLAALSGCI